MRGHVARSRITKREIGLMVLGSALLAVVMHWPLPLHLSSSVPKDLGDPLAQAWQPAWDGHALTTQPLHLFDSNQFWPFDDTLAFSDALIGYAPAGLVGDGPDAAIVRYNLLFLFCYALASCGAYLLAREIGLGPAGAAVAGVAFAYAPFRLAQDGHLHVISSGGIPLALAFGLRGYRLLRPGWVIAAFAVATWQLSIGFSLGLPMAYGLALLALIAAVFWQRAGRPPLPRAMVAATVAGGFVFLATAYVLSRPYERVADEHPQANRSPDAVQEFSGPLKELVLAPEENEFWGGFAKSIDSDVLNPHEKTLFPGIAIGLLAIAGALGPPLGRRLRIGLAAGVAGVTILAMGFQAGDGLLWPYRIVYDYLPGWEGIRTPGRLATFSTLGLALLAGAGPAALMSRIRDGGQTPLTVAPEDAHPRMRERKRGVTPLMVVPKGALVALLVLLIAIEGRGLPFDPFDAQAQPGTPDPPASVADVPAPQVHLPALRPEDNRRYLLWSTDGFPAIVNGRSSVQPTFTTQVIEDVESFPDEESVQILRDAGVKSVVLHTDRTFETPWQSAEFRSVAGLGITRSERGDLVIYEIGSGTSSDDGSG